jgi:hypothetical protein
LSCTQLAEALEVSPADMLGVETMATRKHGKPGPTPQLQLRFECIQRLPHKDQEFIIRFLDTVMEKRKRSEKCSSKPSGKDSTEALRA